MNRNFVLDTVKDTLQDCGVATVKGPNAKSLVRDIFICGQFNGLEADLHNDGSFVLTCSKRGNRATTQTATNNDVARKAMSDRGLVVPRSMLNKIGVTGDIVYLRPVSSDIFLVNRSRGTNPDTAALRRSSNGSFNIPIRTLENLFGEYVTDEEFDISVNGTTANSLLVKRAY